MKDKGKGDDEQNGNRQDLGKRNKRKRRKRRTYSHVIELSLVIG